MLLLLLHMTQAATGRMQHVKLQWRPDAAVTVVMAAKGYPGEFRKGTVIRGLNSVTGAKVKTGLNEVGAVFWDNGWHRA
jgi:phosphoribosylamine-glycine ligase